MNRIAHDLSVKIAGSRGSLRACISGAGSRRSRLQALGCRIEGWGGGRVGAGAVNPAPSARVRSRLRPWAELDRDPAVVGIQDKAPRCPGAVEAKRGRGDDVRVLPLAGAVGLGAARVDRDSALTLGAVELLGQSLNIDRPRAPTGTVESKMTMASSGRPARLREWRVSGRDTHRKLQ